MHFQVLQGKHLPSSQADVSQPSEGSKESVCLWQDGEASVAQGTAAVRRRLEEVLTQLQAGACSDDDVQKRIESFQARWPSVSQAQAELTHARRKPKDVQEQSGKAEAAGTASWKPSIGDTVRLLRMGDSTGKV